MTYLGLNRVIVIIWGASAPGLPSSTPVSAAFAVSHVCVSPVPPSVVPLPSRSRRKCSDSNRCRLNRRSVGWGQEIRSCGLGGQQVRYSFYGVLA